MTTNAFHLKKAAKLSNKGGPPLSDRTTRSNPTPMAFTVYLVVVFALAAVLAALWSLSSVYSYLATGRARSVAEEAASAYANLEVALALNPNEAQLWIKKSELEELIGRQRRLGPQYEDLEKDAARGVVRAPGRVVGLMRLALLCSRRERHAAAAPCGDCANLYRAIIARYPTYSYAHLIYADYLYQSSKADTEKLSKLAPVICTECGVAANLNNYNRKPAYDICFSASDSFDVLKTIDPTNNTQWNIFGVLLGRKKGLSWTDLPPTLAAFLKDKKADAETVDNLTRGLAKSHRIEAGYLVLKDFVVRHDAEIKGKILLTRYLYTHRKNLPKERLIAALQSIPPADIPNESDGIFLLNAACWQGRYDIAAHFYQALAPAYPYNHKLHAAWGRCNLAKGSYLAALDSIRKGISIDPSDPDNHVDLGDVYLGMKEFNRAVDAYQKALEIRPGHPRAKAALKKMNIY